MKSAKLSGDVFVEKFVSMIGRMLKKSESTGMVPRLLAENISHKNYGLIAKDAYYQETRKERIINLLQQKKMYPGSIKNKIREQRIQRTFDSLMSSFL